MCSSDLVIATFGVIGAALFGWAWADGVAALAIGALLIALAGIVLHESKSLLTGEAVSQVILDGLREALTADKRVTNVDEILSMYLGPDEILLAATLKFRDSVSAHEVREIADGVLQKLHEVEPRVTRLFLRADGKGAAQ